MNKSKSPKISKQNKKSETPIVLVNRNDQEDCTFSPKINKKSSEIWKKWYGPGNQ